VLPRQAHGGEFANFIVRPRMLVHDKHLLFNTHGMNIKVTAR